MPVEQIYIVVTEDGIRSFKWKGMSQEEKIVTENVKLLAFDEIENRLIGSGEISFTLPVSLLRTRRYLVMMLQLSN